MSPQKALMKAYFSDPDIMVLSPMTPYGEANISENGQWLVATTEHPQSSHGLPVVVDAGGTAYGPHECGDLREGGCMDLLPALRLAGYKVSTIQED